MTQTVLINCSGICVEMTRAFMDAGARVIATDSSPYSPTLHVAQRGAVIPPVKDPGYVPAIAQLVEAYDVDLIVSMTDEGTIPLSWAAAAGAFGNALTLLARPQLLERLWDKYKTSLLLERHGFDQPRTWLSGRVPDDVRLPALMKARQGANGRGIYPITSHSSIAAVDGDVELLVQELCEGDEYSIDVFCDLDSRCINAIPRRMIRVRGGETIVGETVYDEELIALGKLVSETLGCVGATMIQGFREADGRFLITDINPRFGGGSNPAILAAGGDYHRLALALARGEKLEPRLGQFRSGVVYSRYWSEVLLHGRSKVEDWR